MSFFGFQCFLWIVFILLCHDEGLGFDCAIAPVRDLFYYCAEKIRAFEHTTVNSVTPKHTSNNKAPVTQGSLLQVVFKSPSLGRARVRVREMKPQRQHTLSLTLSWRVHYVFTFVRVQLSLMHVCDDMIIHAKQSGCEQISVYTRFILWWYICLQPQYRILSTQKIMTHKVNIPSLL